MSLTDEKRSEGGRNRAQRLSAQRRSAIARAGGLARAEKNRDAVTADSVEAAKTALTLLQSIRTQFRGWGCERTAKRLDDAISSAKGAVRNLPSKLKGKTDV